MAVCQKRLDYIKTTQTHRRWQLLCRPYWALGLKCFKFPNLAARVPADPDSRGTERQRTSGPADRCNTATGTDTITASWSPSKKDGRDTDKKLDDINRFIFGQVLFFSH